MLGSDENFVEIGTPLEPIEEEEVPKKKPVNVSDQIVVDENGRRRFHGAFTGGFSAGYYNTVGSKEGWEPATFKSTRSDRFSKKNQNIQDFMDDEDLGAFGIAPQILRTTGDFDKKESRKRAKPTQSDGPIPGEPVLDMFIQPVRDTVGIRILQRMGWRPGQGVGPRTKKTKDKTKRKEQKLDGEEDRNILEGATVESMDLDSKVYGCSMPPGVSSSKDNEEDSTDSEIENLDSNVLFAPEDKESPLCNPKENTYGLGYTGLDRNALAFGHGHIDLFGVSSELRFRVDNKKLNIKGEAFGIGAFEEEDEEVYSREDISQYDFALETTDERKSRLAKEKLAKRKKGQKDEGIEGFTKAKNPPPRRKYFSPPTLPKDFEPVAMPKRRSRFDKAADPTPKDTEKDQAKRHGLERHNLTIEERQVLLGEAKERVLRERETPEELAERVKVEQLQKAEERGERLRKFADVLQAFSSNKPRQDVEGAGKTSFKPFARDPEKQDRYEKYMALVAAGYKECLKDLQPLDMTEWQKEREKVEFERATMLFKPISQVMSSRFVSAQSHDISHVVPIKEEAKEKDPTQDPKVAAKMSLFGKLTHEILEWHPDRLLCKRLNVPHPYPESKMVGLRKVTAVTGTPESIPAIEPPPAPVPVVKKSLFDNLDFSKPPPGLLPILPSLEPPPPGTEDKTIIKLEPGVEAMEITDSLSTAKTEEVSPPPVPTRPSIDLFKEIFADTSSESEDEEEPPPEPLASRVPLANTGKSNYNRTGQHEPGTAEKSVKNGASSQIKRGNDQSLSFHLKDREDREPLKPHTNQGGEDEQSTGIKRKNEMKNKLERNRDNKAVKEEEEDDDEEDVYGPKPPSSITVTHAHQKAAIGKTSTNPLMRMTADKFFLDEEEEVDGVEWVEKGQDLYSTKKTNKKSSSHHLKKKKSKKSKEKTKEHQQHKSTKHKKQKKHKSSGSKQRKRKKSSKSLGSEDEDSGSTDSSSSSPVQIHQSLSSKVLLSKLKELTR